MTDVMIAGGLSQMGGRDDDLDALRDELTRIYRTMAHLARSAARWSPFDAAQQQVLHCIEADCSARDSVRAKLGLDKIELRLPLQPDPVNVPPALDELVRAADMLYTLGERDVVLYFVTDLAEQSVDVAALVALGELTARRNDARAMLQIGKAALGRGLALDPYAFPTIGIPQHSPIGPSIDRSIIYSVARTESAFDQRDKSAANAVGLMQVTPEAGRDTAKRFGVKAGIVVARSLVGNFVTSLDMAGCSTTVSMLDQDMKRLWDAPVHTSALRWGM